MTQADLSFLKDHSGSSEENPSEAETGQEAMGLHQLRDDDSIGLARCGERNI